MKLHLPKRLLTALLSCCTCVGTFFSTLPSITTALGLAAYLMITQAAHAYVFTWTGDHASNDIHQSANWSGDVTLSWNSSGDEGISQGYPSATGDGRNILRFAAGVEGAQIGIGFNSLVLGGIIIDENAVGHSIVSSGRDVAWRASFDADITSAEGMEAAKTNLIVNDDFTFTVRKWVYEASAIYQVAVGKTLTVNATSFNYTGASAVPTISQPSTPYEHVVQGGGRLLLNLTDYDLSRSANWTVTSNSTLDLSAIAAGGTASFGSLTLSAGGVLNMGSNSATLQAHDLLIAADAGALSVKHLTITGELTNAGSLALNGDLILSSSITNTGNLTLGADTRFDLSSLVGDVDGTTTRYTIISGGGTVDLSSFSFDASDIIGVITAGRTWSYENGVITSILAVDDLTHHGGPLDWSSEVEIGAGIYHDGDIVRFATSDATVRLVGLEQVAPSFVEIDAVTVSMSSTEGARLSTSNLVIVNAGELNLTGDILSEETRLYGDASTTVRVSAAGADMNYADELGEFEGHVVLSAGALRYSSQAQMDQIGYASLSAASGTTLAFAGTSAVDIALTGEVVIDTASGTTTLNGTLSGSGTLTKTGGNTLNLYGDVAHTGALVVQSGTVRLGDTNASSNDIGFSSITLESGSTLFFHHAKANLGADLTMDNAIFHNQDSNTTNVTNGDPLNPTVNERISWGSWTLSGDNRFEYVFKGIHHFERLTGSGTLTVANATGANYTSEARRIFVETLQDYNGSIALNTGGTNFKFFVENVNQAAGNAVTFSGKPIYSNEFSMQGAGSLSAQAGHEVYGDFNKTGAGSYSASTLSVQGRFVADSDAAGSIAVTDTLTAQHFEQLGAGSVTIHTLNTDSLSQTGTGSLTITTLNISESGQIEMKSAGTSSIQNVILGNNSSLTYYGEGSELLSFTSVSLAAGASVVNINLNAFTQEQLLAGVNLGQLTNIESSLSFFNVSADQYVLSHDAGNLIFTLNTDEVYNYGWDSKWGSGVLADAPTAINIADSINATTGLAAGGSIYFDAENKKAVINLVGGGGDGISIFGGYNNSSTNSGGASVDTDSWIRLDGGTFDMIVGGNYANNYAGGSAVNFIGDAHIVIAGGEVDHVIGGNFKDGMSPKFEGNTYISVFADDALKGSIIGGSTTAHNASASFDGNTNIFIYAALNDSSAAAVGDIVSNLIVGGSMWGANVAGSVAQTGNTNITVDLSSYSGSVSEFGKVIIGASYAGESSHMTLQGNSTIAITGKTGVNFTQHIVGSMYHISGKNNTASTHTGDTSITISGDSSFAQRIIGAGYNQAGVMALAGNTNVSIDGGVFNNLILGGFHQHAGTTTLTGSTHVDINGGSISGVYGGGLIADGISSFGLAAGDPTTRSGSSTSSTNVMVTDGIMTGIVAGGSRIEASGSVTMAGTSNLTITGGDFSSTAANIVGGSQLLSAATGSVTQNGINLTLSEADSAYAGKIIGGHLIEGTDASHGASSTGDISLSVTGADTRETTIYGGSYSERNSGTVTQGSIHVTLESGSVGSVYAAGYQSGTASMTSAETTVELHAGVSFADGAVVDGGYAGSGVNATVTGSKTIAFVGTQDYSSAGSVSFRNFDTVHIDGSDEVTLGANNSVSSINTDGISKSGSGTLVLTDQTGGSVSVEQGTLKLSGDNDLDVLAIAASGRLDVSLSESLSSAEVSFADGAALTISTTNAMALSDTVTVALEEGAKIKLDIEGALTGSYTKLDIFTNLTLTEAESTFNDATFSDIEIDGSVQQALTASSYLSQVNGASLEDDVYLVYIAGGASNGSVQLWAETASIPEPRTVTLSLLSLAGLLARRRRQQQS